ncbi:MAG: hypothetical protein PHR77_04695 [Kiritimatiellae bacterium]|nr:hypothetical protein [Kiritimatiellia bacterium]MDD5519474.1 hypothetical protein [Kiritimatiellia bacterium]
MESKQQTPESFLSRQYLFEYLLRQEHERVWKVDKRKGSCRFKGMGCRGNIVWYRPTMAAAIRFIEEYGYTVENLTELCNWYLNRGQMHDLTDAEELGRFLQQFLKRRQRTV